MVSTDQAECMSRMLPAPFKAPVAETHVERISSFNDAEPPFHCSGVVAEAE